MLIFGLCSTSDDWPGWSMDSNPICHLSPAKNIKCLFFNYVQLLIQLGWSKPHPPPLSSQKNEMLIFGLHSTSDDWPGLVRWTRTPSATSLQPKNIKCLFFNYVQLLMISWAGQWTRTPSTTPLQPKK